MKFRSTVIFILILYFIVLSTAETNDDSDEGANSGDIIDPVKEGDDGDDAGDEGGDKLDDNIDKDDDLDTRIINGYTPGPLDNPFVVRLKVTFPDDTSLCSGVLLSDSWVVTAGHCADDASLIVAQLGFFTRTEGPLQTINVTASNIFVHQNYFVSETEVKNDIALLRLNPRAKIFTTTRRIRPIHFACSIGGTFAGRTSRACGWGITTDDAITSTETLQCVQMPVIRNSVCIQAWPTFILPSHICTATLFNRTTCAGDSGGPLFVNDRFRRPQLIGLTSFGTNPCAQTKPKPSVFTRITFYSNWIRNRTMLICNIL